MNWLKLKFAIRVAVVFVLIGSLTALASDAANKGDEVKAWREVLASVDPPTPPLKWMIFPPTQQTGAQWVVDVLQPAYLKSANLARDFYTSFPDNTNALEARMIEFRQLGQLIDVGRMAKLSDEAKVETARLISLETDLLKTPALTEKRRFEVREKQVSRIEHGSPGDFEKYAEALREDYPDKPQPYHYLFRILEKSDEMSDAGKNRAMANEMTDDRAPAEIRKRAQGVIHRLDSMNHPIGLQFTAVDGRDVDLAKLRGKVVMIVFWRAWLPAPKVVLPEVAAAYRKFQAQGLEVIGISLNKDASKLASFVKEHGIAWPQYCDGQGGDNKFALEFGIYNTPVALLVDKQGNLRSVIRDLRKLDAGIANLLAK